MNDGNDTESEKKSPQTPANNVRNTLSPEDLYANLVHILPENPHSVEISIQIKQKRRLNAEDEEDNRCLMYAKSTTADPTATLTESEAAKKFLHTPADEGEIMSPPEDNSIMNAEDEILTESEATKKVLKTTAEKGTIPEPPDNNAILNAKETTDQESTSSSLSEKEAATKYLQTPAGEDEVTNPRDTNAILEMVLNPTRETTYSYTTSSTSSEQDKEDEDNDEKGETVVPSSNEFYQEDETEKEAGEDGDETEKEAGQDREVEKGARAWTDDTTPKLPTPSGQDNEEEKAVGSSSSTGGFYKEEDTEKETEKGGASKDGYSSDSSTTLSEDEAAEKFHQTPEKDSESDKEDEITNPRDTNAILSMVMRQKKDKKSE